MFEPHRIPSEEVPEAIDPERIRLLVERMRRGDEAALDALMDLYWGRLLRYATRILGSRDAAEDAVQEAFVRLWANRLTTRPDASAAAFLYATTRNLCLNEERRIRVRARFSLAGLLPRPAAGPTPLDDAEASEMEEAARLAIGSLSPRRREIFELTRQHGLSYREIAEVMGISQQTVANQMSAALDQLRKRLLPHSGSLPRP